MIATEFISRDRAVSYYSNLAQAADPRCDASLLRALELLPPFLCSQLLRGRSPTGATNLTELFLGNTDGEVREFREIRARLCVHGLRHDVLGRFDLADAYEVAHSDKRERFLRTCLAALLVADPERFQFITNYTSMICWLKRRVEAEFTAPFSSTSFHEFPYCTFLTDLSLFCIPPHIVFTEPSIYALQENLYHEALHQQLCTIIQVDAVLPSGIAPSQLPRIWIPWREESWDLEHVLHAGYVYIHLLEMRLRVLRGTRSQDCIDEVPDRAVAEALKSAQVLIKGLAQHSAILGPSGQEIVRRLCRMVSEVESGLKE